MSFLRNIIRWILKRWGRNHRVISLEDLKPQTEWVVNLKPSPIDERDRDFAVSAVSITPLPTSFYLDRPIIVKNQGKIGSCGSHAFATMTELLCMYDDKTYDDIPLSELFHYFVVRSKDYENSFPEDDGQHLRYGAKVCAQVGIAPEVLCPYDETKLNDKPGFMAYGFAGMWKLKTYNRCYDIQSIKTMIAQNRPVAFGIKVHSDIFITPSNGDILAKGSIVGGHALCAVGYNDNHTNPDGSTGAVYFVNSWGKAWGRNGFGYIGYNQLARDFIEAWSGTV